MNTNSNSYIFTYATIMIAIVATVLSTTALVLKPRQTFNIEVEKKQNLLSTLGINAKAIDAPVLFEKHIVNSYNVDINGNVIENSDAFNTNLKAQLALPKENAQFPVFEGLTESGEKIYILPLLGKGLWGPIWGYIALKEDMNTIYGAIFDHKGETPGLGAEISTAEFQQPFKDKVIFSDNNQYVGVSVLKPGMSQGNQSAVDGISGGTITCNGLNDMIVDGLVNYLEFFKKHKN